MLKGAVARAPQVTADVGGNLNIASLQDTSSFDAEQKSAGFTLSPCVPPFCYGASSGSVSSAKNQITSDFASVGEQSGIKAGDQGFQVAVKGDTALTGAVIASTDKAVEEGKNRFTTGGTLKTEDIQNRADYDAQGYAVTVSGSTKLGDQTSKAAQDKMSTADKAAAASPTSGLGPSSLSGAGVAEASDQAASTTRAGISGMAGDTAVRSDDAESGIKPIFNAEKVQKELNAQVQIKQAFNREAIAVASALTHEAYRTMFLQKVEVREIMRDEHGDFLRNESGELQTRVVPQEEKSRLRACDDGKVHIANNGIFNNLREAAKNARQNSTASGPQYLIVFPQANNAVSELLVAGYQNFLEGGLLGLTNATKENVDMLNQYGESGLHIDGHSRGALTTQNALEFKATEDDSSGSASNTTVSFFGPAANAAASDQTLSVLQNRSSVSDLQNQQNMVLKLQNHGNDPVGTIIGNNPGTGGTIPQASNTFAEAMRALTGQDFTTHNCYGGGAPEECGKYWSNGIQLVPINQVK